MSYVLSRHLWEESVPLPQRKTPPFDGAQGRLLGMTGRDALPKADKGNHLRQTVLVCVLLQLATGAKVRRAPTHNDSLDGSLAPQARLSASTVHGQSGLESACLSRGIRVSSIR